MNEEKLEGGLHWERGAYEHNNFCFLIDGPMEVGLREF